VRAVAPDCVGLDALCCGKTLYTNAKRARLSCSENHNELDEITPMNDLVQTAATRAPWPVGVLVRALADALSARFNPVRVVGEVSAFARAASGHCYFTLKDESGQLRCAMFRRSVDGLVRMPAEGDRVEVEGRIDLYAPRGDLQLIVERMTFGGQGQLLERFLMLKARLESEGLFDPDRKRPLPAMPQSVVVVTSLGAAALRDVACTLQRRIPHTPVWVFPSLVQGSEAPAALCEALQSAYRWHDRWCERAAMEAVLLVVRGGGSLEDLWAFNDERVVRMLAASPMPTVSGVGHQTDFTLTDFVADVRAATPTAAAELCASERRAWLQQLDRLALMLQRCVQNESDQRMQRLDGLASQLTRPGQQLAVQHMRLNAMQGALRQGVCKKTEQKHSENKAIENNLSLKIGQQLTRHHHQLEGLAGRWLAMDPSLVLKRGYAWLQTPDGQALTCAKAVQSGDPLTAFLADGEVALLVR